MVLLFDIGFNKFYSGVFVKEKQKTFVELLLCLMRYVVHFTYIILFRLKEVQWDKNNNSLLLLSNLILIIYIDFIMIPFCEEMKRRKWNSDINLPKKTQTLSDRPRMWPQDPVTRGCALLPWHMLCMEGRNVRWAPGRLIKRKRRPNWSSTATYRQNHLMDRNYFSRV